MGPQIFHDGQIVGMVVADAYEAAQEAASLVKVFYDDEKPSATFTSADCKSFRPTIFRLKQAFRRCSKWSPAAWQYWIKSKNPNAPAVKRAAEEDWGR
jgi:hypothetical protein